MARLRVKAMSVTDATGTYDKVNLPTYAMIDGTEERDPTTGRLLSVEVLIPDDEYDRMAQKFDKPRMRKKYAGHLLWDRSNIGDDVQV